MVASRTATESDIYVALESVNDPEMPINIVDLGMIGDVRLDGTGCGVEVDVQLLPTFVGCPALPMIAENVEKAVGACEGVKGVTVSFVFDPPWSVDRISDRGRISLAGLGVSVPLPPAADCTESGLRPDDKAVACPFCGSGDTSMESRFGPTRCRMIYYCRGCRNSFEHMKRL